jgi:hypothetical protein
MADSDELWDPYVVPGTGLLLNLIGASTKAELENAEADLFHPGSRLLVVADVIEAPSARLNVAIVRLDPFGEDVGVAVQEHMVDVQRGSPEASD